MNVVKRKTVVFAILFALSLILGGSNPSYRETKQLVSKLSHWKPVQARRLNKQLPSWSYAWIKACEEMKSPRFVERNRCPALMAAIAYRESSWNPRARGRRGEVGLNQLMPHIFRALFPAKGIRDLWDPVENILMAGKFLDMVKRPCLSYKDRPDFTERVLSKYGGAGCRHTFGARRAIGWANEIYTIRI